MKKKYVAWANRTHTFLDSSGE